MPKEKNLSGVARGNVASIPCQVCDLCLEGISHTHINKFWLLNKGGNFDIINDHAEVDINIHYEFMNRACRIVSNNAALFWNFQAYSVIASIHDFN